jgi:tetratricopeptide (TPR) repeat protein
MIVERHYDDEALIDILQGNPVPDSADPHLASCSVCAETLASFRDVTDVLGEESVWDSRELRDEPSGDTISRLRNFASTLDAEAGRASFLVSALLRLPRETWAEVVSSDGRYRTVGVARHLIGLSESAVSTDPRDAVELSRAAAVIADAISDSDHELDVVFRLRGAAARHLAYALFIVGDAAPALEQVERAQREFERCSVADYDKARLNIVRVVVYRLFDRHGEALPFAREAARVFEAYGDRTRLASALQAEAYLLLFLSRFSEALAILRSIENRFLADMDDISHAINLGNIGFCHEQLGDTAEALASYSASAILEQEAGAVSNAVHTRYAVAMILRSSGEVAEAKRRLVKLVPEAKALGMKYLTAAVELELADILITEKDFEQAEKLCASVIDYFEREGIAQAPGAMMALSFLRESAQQRRLTREAVRHVKRYIERLEQQPNLLFASPPPPPQ